MGTSRLEAFSDGVIAIIITIMVLEMKVPHGVRFSDLSSVLPVFLSYVLSFVYVAVYWNNHHHMLRATGRIDGRVMWANLHLLFWLSLFPFVTAWAGENRAAVAPNALYGAVLLMAATAYWLLQNAIVACNGRDSTLALAVGGDLKGKLSMPAYALAIGLAFVNVWIANAIYVLVAAAWLIPDRRIEARIRQ